MHRKFLGSFLFATHLGHPLILIGLGWLAHQKACLHGGAGQGFSCHLSCISVTSVPLIPVLRKSIPEPLPPPLGLHSRFGIVGIVLCYVFEDFQILQYLSVQFYRLPKWCVKKWFTKVTHFHRASLSSLFSLLDFLTFKHFFTILFRFLLCLADIGKNLYPK